PERLRAASGSSAIKTTGRRESVLSSRGRLACRAFGTRSTPRAPEPSPELSLDALDVGTRRERSHPGNDLRGGDVTTPVTEKPRPHSLDRRYLRQTLRRRHAIRPHTYPPAQEALWRLATGATGRYK